MGSRKRDGEWLWGCGRARCQVRLLGEAGLAWDASCQHVCDGSEKGTEGSLRFRREVLVSLWQFPYRRQGRHGLTAATHF